MVLVKTADKNSNLRFQRKVEQMQRTIQSACETCECIFSAVACVEMWDMSRRFKRDLLKRLKRTSIATKTFSVNIYLSNLLSYPEVIKDDPSTEDISIESNQVWLERVDEETGLVSVDVHTVLLQQGLLVSPAFWPVLCQLLYLCKRHGIQAKKGYEEPTPYLIISK